MIDPPPVPRRLHDVPTVVAVGSGLWLAGALALLVAWFVGGRPLDVWFTTCLAGALLGAIGYGIFAWQRAAVRRGSRMAQDGLE
ncbi:MAG TPA: DUF2530 domain-containing protein [Pseudonocardia sp.]|nr:DUF2530 domain-containing protein [Pseudonocardia sp.]